MPTSSQPAALLGSQHPRIRSVPRSKTSAGDDAVDLCAAAGVNLDDWQAYALRDALGERPDGKWTSGEVGLVVPRQNGKGEILLARELAGLYLFNDQLIIHTAHEFKTASEAFLRIKNVVTNCDELRRGVKAIREANGEQGIELLNGNRLRFLARSKGSGRGFSGDLIILDEAYELPVATMGALFPTMAARRNPQLWYASSAGQPDSEVLHALRERGITGSDPQLCYLEWSAEDDADDEDLAAVAQANPALGIRIPVDYVIRERAALAADMRQYRRERLGIWEDETTLAVIDAATWAGLGDPDSQISGRISFAVDISPDRAWTSIAAAGVRPDGLAHVEVVEHRPGTEWAVDYLRRLQAAWNPIAVILQPDGPAGSLLPDMLEAGVKVTPTHGTREVAQACGAFYDAAVHSSQIRHQGTTDQPELTSAIASATKKYAGDGAWIWDRKGPHVISPLVAVTLAFWGYLTNNNDQGGWMVVLT